MDCPVVASLPTQLLGTSRSQSVCIQLQVVGDWGDVQHREQGMCQMPYKVALTVDCGEVTQRAVLSKSGELTVSACAILSAMNVAEINTDGSAGQAHSRRTHLQQELERLAPPTTTAAPMDIHASPIKVTTGTVPSSNDSIAAAGTAQGSEGSLVSVDNVRLSLVSVRYWYFP